MGMTPQQEAAMRQALEALESLFNGQVDPDRANRCSDAINALTAALEQPTSCPHGMVDTCCEDYANCALEQPTGKQHLQVEQPAQQEPAFYRHEDGHLMTPDRAKFLGFDLNDLQALYTRPQAREWVGLTQQDIDIAFDDTQEGGGFDDFARAIEAKLREKNA